MKKETTRVTVDPLPSRARWLSPIADVTDGRSGQGALPHEKQTFENTTEKTRLRKREKMNYSMMKM